MSSSKLPQLVEQKRGHCHEIGNIYYRYLNGIVSNLFQDSADRDKVHQIFMQLGNADADLFLDLTVAAEKMRELAKQVYRLNITGKRSEAIELVKAAAPELLDMRDKFNDADITMRKISSEFIKAARVAPT